MLAVLALLQAGNTLTFIAPYRKEATQGLDEVGLRVIEDTIHSVRELADHNSTVLKTVDSLERFSPVSSAIRGN